jgi:signal transduction histidine kinase
MFRRPATFPALARSPIRAFVVVSVLFFILMLVVGVSATLLEIVLLREKEANVEYRLESVGATLIATLELGQPGVLRSLAEWFSPEFRQRDSELSLIAYHGLSAGELEELRRVVAGILAEAVEAGGLRSAALVTDDLQIIAAAGDQELRAFDTSTLLLPDSGVIEAALLTGRPAATPTYSIDDDAFKRIFIPIVDRVAVEMVDDSKQPDAARSAPTVLDYLPLLLRLEAPASYFFEYSRLRRRLVLFSGVAVVLLFTVGLITLATMRRLDRTNRQLAREDRLRSLGTLASGLAHELRNPLGIMRLSTEELVEELERLRGASHLVPVARESLAEIDRLARLISDVLSFARGESVSGDGRCAVGGAVEAVVTWLRKTVRHGWVVATNHTEDRWRTLEVAIGEDALRQILLNLLRNAVDALGEHYGTRARLIDEDSVPIGHSRRSEAGGRGGAAAAAAATGEATARAAANGADDDPPAIQLRLEHDDEAGVVRVHVSDNGPGISRGTRTAIFEPFYTQRSEGTGLGLPISRRLAESVGGSLDAVAPDALGGAHFVLVLPVAAAGAARPTAPPRRG